MATKKEVAAIVKRAQENRERAVAAGVRNPAPYGQIKIRFLRDTQTARFKLAKGEEWSPQFKRFGDGEVEIGCSPVLFNRFEIIGLEYEFKPKE